LWWIGESVSMRKEEEEKEWKQKVCGTVERFGKLTFNTSTAHSQCSYVALH